MGLRDDESTPDELVKLLKKKERWFSITIADNIGLHQLDIIGSELKQFIKDYIKETTFVVFTTNKGEVRFRTSEIISFKVVKL